MVENLKEIKKIHNKMIRLSKYDRKLFGSFLMHLNTSSLHALNANLSSNMKKIYGFSNIQIADYLDLNLTYLKKNHYTMTLGIKKLCLRCAKEAVTVWIPLVDMNAELGRLVLKEILKAWNFKT